MPLQGYFPYSSKWLRRSPQTESNGFFFHAFSKGPRGVSPPLFSKRKKILSFAIAWIKRLISTPSKQTDRFILARPSLEERDITQS